MIKDEETNAHFLKVIEVLMDVDPSPETPQAQALVFLVSQVQEFEDKTYK